MIKFVKKLFFKQQEPEEKYQEDLFEMSNPVQVRKALLWYWIKYLEGGFIEGHRPMTYREWMNAKLLP